jgi:nitronate monooxygenase
VRILLDAKVPAFSFIYGIPPREILEECHRQGILTIGTATTPHKQSCQNSKGSIFPTEVEVAPEKH